MPLTPPSKYPEFARQLLNNGPLGSPNKSEPSEIKKDTGWLHGERPPRQTFNYLQNLTSDWIVYFDKLWSTSGQINFHFNQDLSTTTGLVFGISAGTITFDGQESTVASTTLTMTANATTVIGFNLDALTISQYLSGGEPTSDFVKLFVVTTNGSAITAVDDRRTPFQVQSRLQSGDNKLIIDGATDTLNYTNNGVSVLYTSFGGDVGINTTTPLGKLHIKDGSSGVTLVSNKDLVIESNDSTVIQLMSPNTASPAIFFADPQANSAGGLEYSHGAGKMHLRVEDQNRVSLDSAGQMVIANASDTVSPLAKLHVKAGTSGAAPISSDGIFVESAGSTHITIGTSATDIGALNFADTGSQVVGAIQYDNSTDKLHLAASGASKVTIVGSNGNVGFGEQTPFAKVHIKQGSSGVASLNAGGDGLFVEDAGIAGLTIGTPNNVEANIFFADPQSNTQGGFQYNQANDTLSLRAGDLQVVQIDGINDVLNLNPHGVNDYSVSTKRSLRINIDSDANQTGASFTVGHDQNTTVDTNVLLKVLDTGNVGVGVTNPTHRLDVAGDARVSGSFYRPDDLGLVATLGNGQNILFADTHLFRDATGTTNRAVLDSLGNTGIGDITVPQGKLHVFQGESGVSSALTDADALILEDSGSTGITIQTPNSASGNIRFVDPESNNAGSLSFNHTTDTFSAQIEAVTKLSISPATTTVTNDLTVAGNLTVNGTITTINSTTVTVDDKNIEIGSVSVPTDVTADGGGITLKGATDKTINWTAATGDFDVSENWDLASGKSYKINNISVLNGTTLGSGVTASSLTSVGTLGSLVVSGNGGFGSLNVSGLTGLGGSAFSGAKLTVSDGTSTAFKFIVSGSSSTLQSRDHVDGSYTPSIYDAIQHIFQESGVETFRTYAGNLSVGAGATALSKLHVKYGTSGISGVVTDGLLVEGSSTTGINIATPNTQVGLIAFADPENTSSGFISYHHTVDTLYVGTAAATKMTVDSAGKVLVGSSGTALGKLHVKQGTSGVTSVSNQADALVIEDSNSTGITIATPNTQDGAYLFADPESNTVGGMTYLHGGDVLTLRTNDNDRLAINNIGDVSISSPPTVNALGKLHIRQGAVAGVSADGNANELVLESNNNVGMTLLTTNVGVCNIFFGDPEGNATGQLSYDNQINQLRVGVNGEIRYAVHNSGDFVIASAAHATTPQGKLHIKDGTSGVTLGSNKDLVIESNDSTIIQFMSPNTASPALFFADPQANSAGGLEYSHGAGKMHLRVEDQNRVSLDSAGQMVIANSSDTVSPLAKLHVKTGTSGAAPISSDGIFVESAGSTHITIGTPNNREGGIFFADPESNTVGGMSYNHSSEYLALRAGNVEGARLEGDGDFFLNTGRLGVGISPSSGKIHSQVTSADNVTYIETVTSGNPVLSLSATGAGGYQLYNDRATNSFRIKAEGGADRVTVSSAGDVTVAQQLLVKQGTAGSPGISFTGESGTNTGVYSGGEGLVNISCDSNRKFNISDSAFTFYQSGNSSIALLRATSDKIEIQGTGTGIVDAGLNVSGTTTAITLSTTAAPSSSKYFLTAYGSASSDREFIIDSTGAIFTDGSTAITTPAGDYAEMFEWLDGNTGNEDRVGFSVSLSEGKLVKATSKEGVIGIISAAPSILGDSAELSWSGKWLVDSFGRRILDENNSQILSPSYDPEAPYTPRSKRPEWSPVGLLGKLILRKGQQTAPTWIKLKDVNEDLELWLVK